MPAFFDNPAARRWVYGIALAAGSLALIYGLVTGEQLAGWLALIAAVLGVVSPTMALTHMPKDEAPDHGEE